MGFRRRSGGAFADAVANRRVNGAWQRAGVYRRVNNTWVRADAVLSATASPASVSASGRGSPISTPSTTVTVTGNIGTLTYAWRSVGGFGLSPTAPNSRITSFSGNLAGSGDSASGTFVCDVTDAATGKVITTNQVEAYIERIT